ncbi:MAG: zinc-ribbon domain-containing protein [Thermodesulfovibrionales bacterium]|nr:zinc-ribbon domain-containing protein [Thermodesulfovibrionales bacterium]
MVVGCPKCKVKLKIADEKIKPEGLKIKCPKCSTVLMVRKPAAPAPKPAAAPAPRPAPAAAPRPAAAPAQPSTIAPQAAPATTRAPEAPQPIEAQAKELNLKKVLVAHENAMVVEEVMSQLTEEGYLVLPVPNGVDTLVQTMKELPFMVLLDAALPKIDGFEIIKRLKEKEETKDIKTVIISSKIDEARQRKNPASMYGVNAYIDDEDLPGTLMNVMAAVISGQAPPEEEAPPEPPKPVAAPEPPKPAPKLAAVPEPPKPAPKPKAAAGPVATQGPEKARRLARTVLSDIDLYDPEKVLESIRNNKFEAVFAEELREGLKHYQMRIPKEVRAQGNFFQESLDAFLAKKKEQLGI